MTAHDRAQRHYQQMGEAMVQPAILAEIWNLLEGDQTLADLFIGHTFTLAPRRRKLALLPHPTIEPFVTRAPYAVHDVGGYA